MRHALLLANAPALAGGGRPAGAEAPFTLVGTPGRLSGTVAPSDCTIDIVADMNRLVLSVHEASP